MTDPIVLVASTHPDDEFVAKAAMIRNHLEHGYEVHVMWVCNGLGSAVQPQTGLDDAAFIAARDDESIRGCRALGVPFENLHFPADRTVGGALTPTVAFDLIAHVITDVLPAGRPVWLKSYSDRPVPNRHADHIATGAGARMALNAGLVANWRAYAEPWLTQAYAAAGVKLNPETCTGKDWVKRAGFEYRATDLVGRKHGISALSVGPYVSSMETAATSYWHLP